MDGIEHEQVRRLREALAAADYRYDAVAAQLGPAAHAALSRNETTPGLRATTGDDPLATLVRLWPLQAPVPVAAAERALPGLVDWLCVTGILERSVGEVRALVDVRPYADDGSPGSPDDAAGGHDWWVVSDLTPGLDGRPHRMTPEHVLGISSASTSLAQLTVRDPVDRALDLGTGCGVQSLHLAAHARDVVATDVNPRALWMTRLNAALNDVTLDVRDGSLFAPVRDERFDLIVTNPPFVVSPGTGERLVYRDSGLPGDEVVRRIVRSAPGHLAPGGWCQVLANWVHPRGASWQDRVAGWVADSGCDAWVVQREVADPAEYVELWLKDAGLHGTAEYAARYDTWLSWFDEQGLDGVGFGWLNLRRHDEPDAGHEPEVRVEEWPYDVEQPLGPEVTAWARRTSLLRDADDDTLLAARLRTRVDVRQESVGEPGAADPERIVLRQQRGMRRARGVDTVEAGLVGACDGDLTVGQILGALAQLLGDDAGRLRTAYLPTVRELVAEGFLDA